MKMEKDLLDIVKSSLKLIEDDISFLKELDISLPSELSSFLGRMNNNYTLSIEKIVQEDESGFSDLKDILVNINEMRLQQYQKSANYMLQLTKNDLKNAFWLTDQLTVSQKINDIEKKIFQIKSSLTSKEPDEIDNSIRLYIEQINTLLGLQDSLKIERHRSRFNISLKVLFWSIPILVGVWISGKFDNNTIILLTLLIIFSSMLSYLFVVSKQFMDVMIHNKIIIIIIPTLFIIIFGILFWQFYAPLSSFLIIDFINIKSIIFVLFVLLYSLLNFYAPISKELNKSKFTIKIPKIDRSYSPGDKITIPYSLRNKSPSIITEIGVQMFAPGLTVLSKKEKLFNAMAGKSAGKGELKLLEVPIDAVSGEYTIKLKWNFIFKSSNYGKSYDLKLNIVANNVLA